MEGISASDPVDSISIDHDYGTRVSEANSNNTRVDAISIDHDYGTRASEASEASSTNRVSFDESDSATFEIKRLKEKIQQLKNSNKYLKRKQNVMQKSFDDFKNKVNELQRKYEISHVQVESLMKCACEVPSQLFEQTAKRAREIRPKEYHPSIRKFALTLHLCSVKAYRLTISQFLDALHLY